MTAVLLMEDIPGTGVIREASAVRPVLADAGAARRTVPGGVIERMERSVLRGEAVLALYPTWRSDDAYRIVRLARGVLRTDRIAGIPLALPPLALSLLADQLAFVAPYVKGGVLAGLAHRLAAEIHAGAWVNSVARLEHVRAGVGAHVSSYLTRAGFMVTAAPAPRVHRITAARPVGDLAAPPADPVVMLAAHRDGDLDWLRGQLRPALRAVSVTFVAEQPLGPAFWGTRKYAEFVAFSGHLHALRDAVRAMSCRPCPWCGEPAALPVCAFCSMVQPVPPAPPLPPGPVVSPVVSPVVGLPERPVPQVPRAAGGPGGVRPGSVGANGDAVVFSGVQTAVTVPDGRRVAAKQHGWGPDDGG